VKQLSEYASPRVSRAECASNAVSLVVGCADREFIVDVGEDGDVGVDPARQAAAELKHSGLIQCRHDVRSGLDRVGLSSPIPPEIAPEIRLPDLTASGHDRPFGPKPDAPARPLRVAECDIAKAVVVVPEGDLLPQDLPGYSAPIIGQHSNFSSCQQA
jgi:hypothetical protein